MDQIERDLNLDQKEKIIPAKTLVKLLSKGNFLDYIEDASKSNQLVQSLIDELYNDPNATAQSIYGFFHANGYYGVSLEDCAKLMNVVKAGALPCDFSSGDAY